jgi:acyl carrier protein
MAMAMERKEIESAVNEIFVREFELEERDVGAHAQLREDLQLDSLDAVDMVVALEKRFKIRIPEDQARAVKTVGDVYDFLERAIKAEPPAPA